MLLLTWSSRQFWGTILLFVCVKFRSKVVVLIYAILYSVLCNFLKHNIFQKNCKMNEQCFVLPINYGIPYPPCKKTAIHSQKIIAFYLGTIINHCWKEYLKLNFKPDRMVPSTIRTVDLTKCLPSCLTKISHKFDIPETFSWQKMSIAIKTSACATKT